MTKACIALFAVLIAPLVAQQQDKVTLTRLPSTVRQGEIISASLRIESRRAVGEPRVPKVEGLRIAVGRPSRGSSMTIINGRQSSSHHVTYPIEVVGMKVGKFKIPPIEIDVGGKNWKTLERDIEVVKNITGANFGSLTIVPSRKRVYVHEPVRFDVECAVDSSLELAQGRAGNGAPYFDVQVEAEWLSKVDGGELMDVSDTSTDKRVNIVLNRTLQIADVSFGDTGGRAQTVFRYRKSFLPTRAGVQKFEAPLMRFTVLQGEQRDVFGRRLRGQKEYIVADAPIEIEVLPLPTEGRPQPYFGAVGRFAIRAAFDKPMVKVGASVKLVLTISGEGNMEYLRVPELTELPGFHQLGKIENRSRETVVVTYDLAPRTAEVSGIGPIRWNYFDTTPGVEKYVEVETDPLQLTVRALEGEESLPDLPGEAPKEVEAGIDDIFDVKLSSGPAPAELEPAPGTGKTLLFALLPWLLCGLGMVFWRARSRALSDVQGRRARGALRRFQTAIDSSAEPLDAFVDYLADRLGCEPAAVIGPDLAERLRGKDVPEDVAVEVQALVDRGVAARYGGEGGVDKAAVTAAVQSLEESASGVPLGAAVLLLAAVLLGEAPLGAQLGAEVGAQLGGQDLSAAEKAYRDGEYAAAAEGFRAAAEAGDRRAAYNLGNSLFRQGRFARALAAYEKARLAMPRDPELLANIRLARERLNLGTAEGEAFAETVASIRDSYTPMERFWFCILCNVLAAALVCFGGRRLRIVGIVVTVPALLLLVEVAVLLPNRPPKGIVVEPKVAVRAEPNAELAPLMQVRGGVAVEGPGAGTSAKWTQIRVDGRRGFVPADALVIVR